MVAPLPDAFKTNRKYLTFFSNSLIAFQFLFLALSKSFKRSSNFYILLYYYIKT